MNMTLLHGSMEWMIAGGLAAIGLVIFGIKVINFNLKTIIVSTVVWYVTYKLHGNDTAVGAMTATFAVLLFDLIGLPILTTYYNWKRNK